MQTLKVFFATAFGSIIGALVGLQIGATYNHKLLACIGCAVVGFIVGYSSYEFKTFLRAIKTTWNETVDWKSNMLWWCLCFKTAGYFSISFVEIMSFAAIPMLVVEYFAGEFVGVMIASTYAIITALTFNVAFLANLTDSQPEICKKMESFKEIAKEFGVNPIKLWFWIVPKYVLPYVFKALWFVMKFGGNVFKTIHSEERLVCGMDAAIGALIGWHYNHVMIGALIGGIWGVLNFEILSIRIFKLVPRTQSLFR